MIRALQETAVGALAHALARRQGFVVRRPVVPDRSGTFPLSAVRTGPPGRLPVLIVPGGPGLGSVVPYANLRSTATRLGLHVIMAEHRGVGLSRGDGRGGDLPVEAVTVQAAADDLAAVLDRAGQSRAVVYGNSYGSYLAQVFAARHPDRVAAMVLDSPLLSVEDDLAVTRSYRRRLLWDGEDPALAAVAAAVRGLAATGVPMAELSQVVQVMFEFAGPRALLRLLLARRRGRAGALWRQIGRLGEGDLQGRGVPYVMEPDLVAGIAHGELRFGIGPDGGPLDPQLPFAEAAVRRPYCGEPFDLPAHLPGLRRPLVVISGDRDLRTPRPVAERLVRLAPDAVLVPLHGTGHSALDAHQLAALHVARAVVAGNARRLPAQAGRLSALPRRGPSHRLGQVLRAVV
ncbi:alpha/beta fold hydrolase [Kineosporia sp. J2-2]|uniref:Alpha/beta fold hydrolase n=1 Tax=Kineosporia corallincola TaxID=2835133 RepID=A0ABS5TRE8_9ACTN|nr:alpha/beta hydrolase [Kineosporia corallincola]MBT0773358.1 alpha/beta fold hydrolase [Kineosporia corallincola]